MSYRALPRMPHALSRTLRRVPHAWLESVRYGYVSRLLPRALVLVLLVSVIVGPLVVLGLNWATISSSARRGTAAASNTERVTPVASGGTPVVFAAPFGASSTLPPTLVPTQPATAQPSGTAGVSAARSAPAAFTPGPVAQVAIAEPTAQPPPTPSPTSVPTPSADQIWADMQPRLDAVWGLDTPATIAILDEFRAQFPDYQPARDKLYAALVASAADETGDGALQDAAELLTRAAGVDPERLEARLALQALTPTPTPVPPAEEQLPAVPSVPSRPPSLPTRPLPPPVRLAPVPAPRPTVAPPPPQPQGPPPTPTKVPFRPPNP
jgi:hypothetical protein